MVMRLQNSLKVIKIILISAICLLTALDFSTYAQDASTADPKKGEALFKSLCASCHKRYKRAVGPALHGVTDRHDIQWIYKWIKNSAEMIKSGDAEAVAIYEEYNKVAMNAFPQLSNADVDNILAYVNVPKATKPPTSSSSSVAEAGDSSQGGFSQDLVLGLLVIVLAVLILVLFLVVKTLKSIATANGLEVEDTSSKISGKSLCAAFLKNQFLIIVAVILFLLLSAYMVYGFLMQVGVDQGYQPVQPIHYSHRIHAGDNKIECTYCHSSARVSKHSGIPSLNVCMNCHKSINEVAEETLAEGKAKYGVDYNAEIQKLYKATGWDPNTNSYANKSHPVKWIRIHNLPDFAYFNHSQHYSVAGVACQKCHGPVEEMEIMYQYAPLTMGWCINCHRETNVKIKDNKYYEKIHEELSKKYGVEKLTIAQLGGLECGKCHY